MDREAINRIYHAWLHSPEPLCSKKQVKQPMKTSQPSKYSQSESNVDDPQYPAKLNMYLDNYLHTLGYCARRKRF